MGAMQYAIADEGQMKNECGCRMTMLSDVRGTTKMDVIFRGRRPCWAFFRELELSTEVGCV